MANSGVPPASSLFDSMRMHALVFEELRRIQQLLTEHLVSPTTRQEPGAMEEPGGGELVSVLRRLQLILLQHPLAAQSAFSALVAEGRRFVTTPEGAAWKAALSGSELVRNGRQLWAALALNLLEEDASTVVPSTYLEAIFQAASSPEMEALVRHLRDVQTGDFHGAP
ncbi:hypothetical protein [Vitiosangium sp. GDMCC 1.1324]|uniref:hypothetical protein n=1 Tax=Vitiosangium sp. (strain GDMCC 1.1324) TaxID=2138576 RepID=UPI000D3C42B9|nr:hypothetical protein [Vitiosangium sp. GDMCC 1.1324]PTL79664.1 hypothetical protein DAT35_33205 [Vitiosangium sp. GDMCC 1.1324]